MQRTHWMVVASVLIGGCAGSLAAKKGRPDRLKEAASPQLQRATPPSEEQQLEAIKDALVVEYQAPPSAAPRGPRHSRWDTPPLEVTGRVTDSEPERERAQAPRPEDAVRLALRYKRALFEHCFDLELRRQAIFSGFVVVTLSVSTGGQVTQTRVAEGSPREAAVGHCIARQLRTLKLPELAYDADLILPIRLQASVPVS